MDPLKPARHRGVRAPTHRLVRWQRLALFGSGTTLLLTGAVWLVLHYSVGAGGGELPHPLEAWSLRLHGLAAFVSLFVLGVLAGVHIPRGWQLGWAGQRRSGAWLCALAAVLVATGYQLYYFAPETIRPALGGMHAAVGAAMAALVLRHRRR